MHQQLHWFDIHTNTQKTTLASYQTKNRLQNLSSHIQNHLQINNLHIFTIVFLFRHILFLHDLLIHLFFPFHMSDHHLAKGAFSVIGPWLWNSLPPDTRNSSSLPIFRSRLKTHPLQNCFPSLGSFPSPWTVYPDFDSCYSHFMPYRMTPSVRHRAIEVLIIIIIIIIIIILLYSKSGEVQNQPTRLQVPPRVGSPLPLLTIASRCQYYPLASHCLQPGFSCVFSWSLEREHLSLVA